MRYGFEVIGKALPAFAVGAAIYKIQRTVSEQPDVRTVERGHKGGDATLQKDEEGNTYIFEPTGARVNVKLGPGSFFQSVDFRKAGKLLIARGERKRGHMRYDEVVDVIPSPEVRPLEQHPGVSVRYLRPVENRALEGLDLRTLFEQGIEPPVEK